MRWGGAAALALAALPGAAPIDPAHLALKDCPAEPGCPAIVLLNDIELDNDTDHPRLSVHRIVKVFTRDAIDAWSDFSLIAPSRTVDVMKLTGRTILPDGAEIPVGPRDLVTKKGIYEEGVPVQRRSVKFPGVVPGAILDLAYEQVDRGFSMIGSFTWSLQESIPVLAARLTIRQGVWPMAWSRAGLEQVEVDHATIEKGVERFTAAGVPSIPVEPLAPPPAALAARWVFYVPVTEADWIGQLAGRIAGQAGAFLDESSSVARRVKEIVRPSDAPMERIHSIYRFVQDQFGGEEDRLKSTAPGGAEEAESVDDLLARGYGDEMERTLLFIAMTGQVGFEAALLHIASRTTGALEHGTPDESQLDAFAAAVKTGAGWTFYDPAVKHCPFAMISPRKESERPNAILFKPEKGRGYSKAIHLSGRTGRVYDAVPYHIVTIPVSDSSRNVLTREMRAELGEEGRIRATVTEQATGLADFDIRTELAQAGEEGLRDAVARRARELGPGTTVESWSVQDLESPEKPARIRYRVALPGQASRAGDRWIVPVSLFSAGQASPFGAASRRAPVTFPHTQKTRDKVHIRIPPGHEPEDLPGRLVVQEGPLTLATFFSREMDDIVFTRHLDVNTVSWPAAGYDRLRIFFDKVREADRQAVVFRKKADS